MRWDAALAFDLVARTIAMSWRCNVAQELVQHHITKVSRDQAYLGMAPCRLGHALPKCGPF
jgi:hypothetical protein